MSEIILVRHGQASYGAPDYDALSPLGHEQAGWLGEYFLRHDMRFTRVLRGNLRRHRETLEGMFNHIDAPEPEVDERFDELRYAELEREYLRETGADSPPDGRAEWLVHLPRVFTAWVEGRINAGETFAHFAARTWAAVSDAVDPGGRALVVTSGGVIGVTLARVLQLEPEPMADLMLDIHNASVHRFSHEDGRLRLTLFNASPHLDPTDRAHARTHI